MNDGVVWFMPFEETLIVWLQQLGAGTLLQTVLIMLNNFFSFLGEEIICIGIMGFVYWGLDKKRGERIGAAIMLSTVSIGMLKNIFSRVRPWAASQDIELLREVDGFSFPSGHSANCTALYPTTAYEFRKQKWLRWAAVLVPLLCGLSRCYVGAHWPTDVIVGLCVGLAAFAAVEFGMARLKNRYVFYLALIVVGAAGILYCRTNDYYDSFGLLVGFVLGRWFEEKYTRFENTASPAVALLRTVVGGGLFLAVSSLIKLAIGGIFPAGTQGYLLMRSVRYALTVFLLVGVYPYAFRLEKKLFRKGSAD
ncbi:MAG: phosphatase PAP2 family protein [Subdoligranulum sp.]|nr:phosphatase PAP2 family protein [Subdoligranulum sp.]